MKSLFKLFSALLVLAFMLTACGAPATPEKVVETVKETVTVKETQIVEVPAEKTVVRLSGWASSPSETALLESLLYKFSVENPDILVKYEPITGDYKQALLTFHRGRRRTRYLLCGHLLVAGTGNQRRPPAAR